MISVLILTKNEAADLPGCLDSISWCNDIHILDSYSEDATTSIALARGAKVAQRQFDGYASQRNAGLQLPFRYEWILILDADERLPESSYEMLVEAVKKDGNHINAFSLRRKDYWNNSWLKHAQLCPSYTRLLKKGKGTYIREINEVLLVEGPVKQLPVTIEHFPFSKGLYHWQKKHIIYATMEAEHWLNDTYVFSWQKALFSSSFTERRFHLKGLFYQLPARPFIKWCYMMLVKLAFLDGWNGIAYVGLQTIYEQMIILKYRKLKRSKTINQYSENTIKYPDTPDGSLQ
ncbi:glycosyltransferase family 2 protein [Chitinophaga silvatica]|uniref:Glycosyltransferase family 2 protein n=1 Tax=Chitinophaga silvatica TaxID=2282649 RepID=A0A3E1YHU8_9BACT|nr:glycosyltransferase family 2 protein [Chitinophaga silvatica]RFS26993.1 glycosyltransferase family 2 protein [Chitinophaga silvatica]